MNVTYVKIVKILVIDYKCQIADSWVEYQSFSRGLKAALHFNVGIKF